MIGSLALLLPLVSAPQQPQQPAPPEPGPTVVYAGLPLRDATGRPAAAAYLGTLIRTSLEVRGASFVPLEDMEDFLRERRVRYTDSLSVADSKALGEELGADYVFTGVLLRYDTGFYPHIAIALRLIDTATGVRFSSILVNLSGDDFMGLLDVGAITDVRELELEVLVRVLAAFAEDGLPISGVPEGERARPKRSRGLRSWFVSEDFDPTAVERVIVMPLVNRTRVQGAGRQFSEVLAHALLNIGGVEVVESSELRAALILERVRSIEDLDPETLGRIAGRVGVRYFMMGSVDGYSQEVVVGEDFFPQVEVTVRIVDSRNGQIVAAIGARRRGDEYHKILGLGMVYERLELAVRLANEIVVAFGKVS